LGSPCLEAILSNCADAHLANGIRIPYSQTKPELRFRIRAYTEMSISTNPVRRSGEAGNKGRETERSKGG
jgi:hypothetical protein